MQLKPSRRLLVFCSIILLLIALPVVLAGVALGRAVFTPPVSGTRFAGYDGVHLDTQCADNPAGHGKRAWVCSGYYHVDSRFEIINHDAAAVAWCIQRIDDWFFNLKPAKNYGPLMVGSYPPVPRDWSGCTQMIPIKIGVYGQIIINH